MFQPRCYPFALEGTEAEASQDLVQCRLINACGQMSSTVKFWQWHQLPLSKSLWESQLRQIHARKISLDKRGALSGLPLLFCERLA